MPWSMLPKTSRSGDGGSDRQSRSPTREARAKGNDLAAVAEAAAEDR